MKDLIKHPGVEGKYSSGRDSYIRKRTTISLRQSYRIVAQP